MSCYVWIVLFSTLRKFCGRVLLTLCVWKTWNCGPAWILISLIGAYVCLCAVKAQEELTTLVRVRQRRGRRGTAWKTCRDPHWPALWILADPETSQILEGKKHIGCICTHQHVSTLGLSWSPIFSTQLLWPKDFTINDIITIYIKYC